MFVWILQMSVFKQQTWQHVEPDVWFTGLREQGRLSNVLFMEERIKDTFCNFHHQGAFPLKASSFYSPGISNHNVLLMTCMIDSLHHFVVKLVLEGLLQLLLFNTMSRCYGQKFIAVYFHVLKHRHST